MIDLQPEWAKSAASCVAGVEQDMAALYARYCHAEDAVRLTQTHSLMRILTRT